MWLPQCCFFQLVLLAISVATTLSDEHFGRLLLGEVIFTIAELVVLDIAAWYCWLTLTRIVRELHADQLAFGQTPDHAPAHRALRRMVSFSLCLLALLVIAISVLTRLATGTANANLMASSSVTTSTPPGSLAMALFAPPLLVILTWIAWLPLPPLKRLSGATVVAAAPGTAYAQSFHRPPRTQPSVVSAPSGEPASPLPPGFVPADRAGSAPTTDASEPGEGGVLQGVNPTSPLGARRLPLVISDP